MAENEIPRWAQAALERNQRIQSKARSAVALMKLMEEQDRLSRLAPDTLGTVDPNYAEEVRYEAPGAIRDPESWLNRGLETLAGNAADVILGRPSENPVVDYGLAPIPGVGAAAILGAGGQPGLVDAAGLGGLFGVLKGAAKPVASAVAKKASDYSKDAVNIANKINEVLTRAPEQGRTVLKELDNSLEYGDDIFNHDFFAGVASDARKLAEKDYGLADNELIDVLERLGNREQFGYDLQKQVSELLKDGDMLKAAKELHHIGVPMQATPSPEPTAVVQTQLADMKNKNRIPKYTYDFVADYFGDEGLKNLDNALTKYPKADKPSVNDAVEILRGGYGGERVLPIKEYSPDNPYATFVQMLGIPGVKPTGEDEAKDVIRTLVFSTRQHRAEKELVDPTGGFRESFGDKMLAGLAKSINNSKFAEAKVYNEGMAMAANLSKAELAAVPAYIEKQLKLAKQSPSRIYQDLIDMGREYGSSDDALNTARRMKELATSPTQDWETIIRKQELKDARDAEKEAKKAAKKAQEELKKASAPVAPKVEPVAPKVEPVVVSEPVAATVEPVVVPEVPKGGPNRWEENGWTSKDVNQALFEKYGKNLNEKSKRDAFVVDSLAKHWANQLMTRPGFTSAEILDNLDRANARHTFTNYDDVSSRFSNDVESNLRSGNMPGTAVQLLQRYKNNVRVPGKTVPTMVLGIEERPKIYTNPRIWPDMAEGVDLYELLFRPMIDRKLNEINPNYWTY